MAIQTTTQRYAITMASGSAGSLGNNTLLTPASGHRLRLSYLSYNAATAVEAAFRLGATGALFLRNSVLANSVIAKDFGPARYVEGGTNDPLILNLSAAVATIWNAGYQEIR